MIILFILYILSFIMAIVFLILAVLWREDIEKSIEMMCYSFDSCFAGLGIFLFGLFIIALNG